MREALGLLQKKHEMNIFLDLSVLFISNKKIERYITFFFISKEFIVQRKSEKCLIQPAINLHISLNLRML